MNIKDLIRKGKLAEHLEAIDSNVGTVRLTLQDGREVYINDKDVVAQIRQSVREILHAELSQ